MSEFSIKNLLRIADEREARLEEIRKDLPNIKKRMEGDEFRKFRQHCWDERTIIFMLRKMAEFLAERRINPDA